MTGLSVYFNIMASKNLQKSSAIQNNSITLLSVIIAIIVCNSLYFSTIKLQQFSLITKFTTTYISSNSRYINKALGPEYKEELLKNARIYTDEGLLEIKDDHLRLTEKGIYVSDMLMSGLMIV